ncbi:MULTISPECIES: anti-sigma factor family protein [Lysobacter]|jgi:anti-sigma factor RsiW|uniref:anti-sigma factor family protein n=2 Tax=Lysobacteraceae TaxID=32033 RepID=UPI001F29087C|nr:MULTISPECIES: anti-sigma factor [Lysobacter]UJB18935.1 anti-sigma factor [Lysobacter capsici]UJQ27340.1 anti-sigma factor [Lysobacter gummosus]
MSTPPNEHDLHAYVDGRLDAASRADVEAWLSRHPERLEEIQAWQRDAQQLRAALAGESLAPPSELDPARVRGALARRRSARYAMAAAVLLSIGVGGLGGWQAREWSQPAAPPALASAAPMADAIQAHRLFAVRHDLQPDRVAADLQPWLEANFRQPMKLPDLSGSGFRQVGGRLLATDQGAAALIVYEDAAGNAISFYIRPPGPHRYLLPRGDRRDGDLLAQYWSRGGYNYAMVSGSDDGSTRVVKRALQAI